MDECDLFQYHKFMGEDLTFNMLLFPYISSLFFCPDDVYVYRDGGLTSGGYNPRSLELLDLSDMRIELLDKYAYEKSYKMLFVEYTNIIVSHLVKADEF